MKNDLRKLIRNLILESVESNAKGVNDLIPGVNKIVKKSYPNDTMSLHLWFEGDDYAAARLTTVRTDNPKVLMVGAAYIDDDKADGFGPLLADIAMELTTQAGKWLAIDRASVEPDAERMWQFYKDVRMGQDVRGLQLDNHQNLMTPEDDDNIDNRMAEERFWQTRWSYYYNKAKTPEEKKAIKQNYYRRSSLMWAFKKDMVVVPQLRDIPGMFEEK